MPIPKHIFHFETQEELNEAYKGSLYNEPWVSYTEQNSTVEYNDDTDYEKMPLTIEALSSGEITCNLPSNQFVYSKNGGAWTHNSDSDTISVVEGDEIAIMCLNQFNGNFGAIISSSARFNVKGNVVSIIYNDYNHYNRPSFPDNAFKQMFSGCTTLISAKNLTFSSNISASKQCCENMFNGCTSLTTAPRKLPMTTLALSCYEGMFSFCSALAKAPELPATTLADSCYSGMFNNCTSLTTAPELPATTLAPNCYAVMFNNCTSLTTAPELPATTLSLRCYTRIFQYCTSLTTAPELPATTLADSCYEEMFSFSGLITAPELPATTLADYCYAGMFSYCTSLTTAQELPATTLETDCYNGMFLGCTNLTTAPELPATTLDGSCYSRMFSGCTSLTTAPELPATTLTEGCYSSMFNGCTNLTTAPGLPATTLAIYCYYSMFQGCTSLTTAPELPATSLVQDCYSYMFHNCERLNYIKVKFIENSGCTSNWVSNVSKYGTFVMDYSSRWFVSGVNGVPDGWRVQYYYDEDEYETYKSMPFTIFSYGTANISWKLGTKTVQYSKNNETWATMDSATTISLVSGDTVSFKGTNASYCGNTITTTGQKGCLSLEGNIMSLTNGDDFASADTLRTTYAFYGLFSANTGIGLASYLQLPATALTTYCYGRMFYGCSGLLSAPILPAKTLTGSCYDATFRNCSSLCIVPDLQATTLAASCCTYTFAGCNSLTSAPELPATTLAKFCYKFMFMNCIGLTATQECLPATQLYDSCYGNMFQNCSKIATAPELPAITFNLKSSKNCYNYMFSGCSKLSYVKAMFTTIPDTNFTRSWMTGVSSSGTFVKNTEATWNVTGVNGVPSAWQIERASPSS